MFHAVSLISPFVVELTFCCHCARSIYFEEFFVIRGTSQSLPTVSNQPGKRHDRTRKIYRVSPVPLLPDCLVFIEWCPCCCRGLRLRQEIPARDGASGEQLVHPGLEHRRQSVPRLHHHGGHHRRDQAGPLCQNLPNVLLYVRVSGLRSLRKGDFDV